MMMETNIMNTKWIVVLACGAALALGACSGSNPAPAAGNGGGMDGNGDGNGGTDPAGPDTRSDAAKAFDTALEAAKTAMTNANTLVMAAETAAQGANTDAARTAAQAAIKTARDALANAVTLAQALEAQVPEGDNERIARLGEAGIQVDRATEAQTAGEAKLRTAEGLTGWSGGALLSRAVPRTLVVATRTARKEIDDTDYTDDGDDLDTALTWEKIPAVMYEDGKILMRPGQGGSGDRLPMRGMSVRFAYGAGGRGFSGEGSGQDFSGNIVSATHAYFDQIVAGLTITPAGLVVDRGRDGAIKVDSDMRIDPTDQPEGSENSFDLSLAFGRPSTSPTGNAEHSWIAALMPTDDQLDIAAAEAFLKDGTVTLPLGTYHVRLSNHAGVDTNLEDPDDAEASARDDTNHYLSYAAYGTFYFLEADYFTADEAASTRISSFASGYDAFKDETGMKTTDVAEKIEGTFKGRTIAEAVYVTGAVHVFGDPDGSGNEGRNLRGDIKLTATISDDEDANKIKGTISNLEQWDPKGHWEAYDGGFTTAELGDGDIGADGSFNGAITDPDDTGTDFGPGFYKGNFYGPLSGLETAGTWIVPRSAGNGLAVVGSFGAALVQEGGAYGHCIAGPQGSCP